MSNEEQVADTIEMLYERLNSYNKQDLFNYGYLLESNEILRKDIEEKDKEIERLKQGYCELKEKCNKGECDCTHEEYNGMCEENIKLDLEIERLNNIINEISKDLQQVVIWCAENKHNENTIERYLVVDYGTIVRKINEIRTKLDKENNNDTK